MADTAGSNQTPATGAGGFDFQAFLNRTLRGDVALAVGILGILVMLLLPMPSLLLDLSLATSISIAVLVLMTALFIKKPLEFSAFPAVLLITTLLRLGLNLLPILQSKIVFGECRRYRKTQQHHLCQF